MNFVKLFDRLRVREGQTIGNGIHWSTSAFSRLVLYFRIGGLGLRVRWPIAGTWPQFSFLWQGCRPLCPGIGFDLERQSLRVNGVYVSLELLDSITLPTGDLYRFDRKGDIVFVTRITDCDPPPNRNRIACGECGGTVVDGKCISSTPHAGF